MKFLFLFLFLWIFYISIDFITSYQIQTNENHLLNTIQKFNQNKRKGILAMDESIPTIGKRFVEHNIKNTKLNRKKYRNLLLNTPDLNKYVSGCILFEETLLEQKDIVEDLKKKNILTGIKLDEGLFYSRKKFQYTTMGLESLDKKCLLYKKLGVSFAKWRTVFQISCNTPSKSNIKENCHTLAKYASICQKHNIVPIVEPEIVMDGNHSILNTFETQQTILKTMYNVFHEYNVFLEGTILKTNMICPGIDVVHKQKHLPIEIANLTIKSFERSVPSAVPIIALLSGGLSEKNACLYLHAIKNCSKKCKSKWNVTFSFGRALQHSCLKMWKGNKKNINKSQQILLQKLIDNNKANMGKYRHHHLDNN